MPWASAGIEAVSASEGLGRCDFFTGTDFEDITCLFNGYETAVEEIASSEKLRQGLAAKFKEYLANHDLEDAIEGFVQTENDPEVRKDVILKRLRAIAAL